MYRLCLSLVLVLLFVSPVWGQEQDEIDFRSHWYIGPIYKTDGLSFGSDTRGAGADQRIGIQTFHRMSPSFGSGGSLWFDPGGSHLEATLDVRWIWDLPLVSPYLGSQLGYWTRDTGGLSLEFKPGILIGSEFNWPFQIDVFMVNRYDIVEALFGSQNPNQLLFGLGASILFKIN